MARACGRIVCRQFPPGLRGGLCLCRATAAPGGYGERRVSLPGRQFISGKTTALKLAASVYGGTSYLQRWRSTDNALEATAAQHSDCLLILDELAQIDPKTAGECAYMLANEQGKARATRTGTPRARQAWRLLFLSAGELGLSDHMAEGMKRINRAGSAHGRHSGRCRGRAGCL
jgi:hypothetical protein